MNRVDREVDRALREITPTLDELAKKIKDMGSNEVKVAVLVYSILKLLGVARIPHALAIGSLEVCKAFVLSVAMGQMAMPDVRELNYIA